MMGHVEDTFKAGGIDTGKLPHPVQYDFWSLAMFNAEKARGIVHTEEYVKSMAELQKQYDDFLGDRPTRENWA